MLALGVKGRNILGPSEEVRPPLACNMKWGEEKEHLSKVFIMKAMIQKGKGMLMGTIPVRPAREAVQADGDFCHAWGEFDEAVCREQCFTIFLVHRA